MWRRNRFPFAFWFPWAATLNVRLETACTQECWNLVAVCCNWFNFDNGKAGSRRFKMSFECSCKSNIFNLKSIDWTCRFSWSVCACALSSFYRKLYGIKYVSKRSNVVTICALTQNCTICFRQWKCIKTTTFAILNMVQANCNCERHSIFRRQLL